jgi:hypothetical protein
MTAFKGDRRSGLNLHLVEVVRSHHTEIVLCFSIVPLGLFPSVIGRLNAETILVTADLAKAQIRMTSGSDRKS